MDIDDIWGDSGFDPDEHEPMQDFGLLPPGEYVVEVEKAEVKPTRDGHGAGLNIQFTVLHPEEFGNRKLFTWINLKNKSQKAVEIGQSELASLARALGTGPLRSQDQLLGGRCWATVKVVKDENRIRGYKAIEGQATPAAPAPAPAAPPRQAAPAAATPAKSAGGKPPWVK